MPEDQNIPKAIMNELGVTGLHQFSGTIFEEFLPQLQGRKGVQIYREMSDNSAIVRGMLTAIEALLRSVEWFAEPASDEPASLDAAIFLEECRLDMSHTWEDFISEVLSMLPYGWSFFEVVYKQRGGPDGPDAKTRSAYTDGKIGWRKFAIRAQTTLSKWKFDDTGGIRGLYQRPINAYGAVFGGRDSEIFIPIEKGLLFRTTSSRNNPEGRSILRSAYRAWYFAKRIEEIEAIGVERDLAGMPIAYVPVEILDQDRTPEATATYNYIKDVVTRVKRDEMEGIIFPRAYDDNNNSMYEFELMTSGGKRQFETGGIIQRYNQQIALSTLSDFILLGHENVGSFALSSDKTELFAVALGSWLDSIEEVLNRHAIPRLMKLNGIEQENWPSIVHGDIEKPDVQEIASSLQSLSAAGALVFPDLELENHIRKLMDLPEADPEERERVMEEKAEAAMMISGMGGGGIGGNPPPQANAPRQQQLGDKQVGNRRRTREGSTPAGKGNGQKP